MPRLPGRYRVISRGSVMGPRRAGSTERGYSSAWQRKRAVWLLEEYERHIAAYPQSKVVLLNCLPPCASCWKRGVVVEGDQVDHIIAHKGDAVRFWDDSNLQALCRSCHSSKTAREDGGFGRGIKNAE